MKKKLIGLAIVIGFLLLIVGIKYILTIPYHKIDNEKKYELKDISDGLIIEDFFVANYEKPEQIKSYKNIEWIDILKDYDCKEEKDSYICTKEDALFQVKETKSYSELLKEHTKGVDTSYIDKDIMAFGRVKEAISSGRIFRSISKQREDYEIKKFALEYIPVIYNLDLISGDIDGYITHPSSRERIIVINDKVTYEITLQNTKVFTDEVIQEIINSIHIN